MIKEKVVNKLMIAGRRGRIRQGNEGMNMIIVYYVCLKITYIQ